MARASLPKVDLQLGADRKLWTIGWVRPPPPAQRRQCATRDPTTRTRGRRCERRGGAAWSARACILRGGPTRRRRCRHRRQRCCCCGSREPPYRSSKTRGQRAWRPTPWPARAIASCCWSRQRRRPRPGTTTPLPGPIARIARPPPAAVRKVLAAAELDEHCGTEISWAWNELGWRCAWIDRLRLHTS